MPDLTDGDLPWHHRRETAEWDGGHCLANVLDEVGVKPAFGRVFLSLIGSATGRRVMVEMLPGEALDIAAKLQAAVGVAVSSEAAAGR